MRKKLRNSVAYRQPPRISLYRRLAATPYRFFFRFGVFLVFAIVLGSGVEAQDPKDPLKGELVELNQEIEALRTALRGTRAQEKSLTRDVEQIEQEIKRTELAIARSEKATEEFSSAIRKIQERISVQEAEIDRVHARLGALLQGIAERDAVSPAALVFSGQPLSQIADDLAALANIQHQLLGDIAVLRELEGVLAHEREALETEQRFEEEAQRLLVFERDELLVKQELRGRILSETRGRTQAFTQRLETDEKNAARIREQLYLLADLGRFIPFGEAYAIAKPLAEATGIRPAFLLAVLQKESRLGALVGTGFWKVDMHPRDWPAFLEIALKLGLDADRIPVSRKPSYGWGGAMGPAQFLPSTWLSYRERIVQLTGNSPPSPWNIEDAFAAAALKLAAGGAAAKTPEGEWKSAMLYFAGGNWRNPAYAFYGDAVEDLVAIFQEQVDILEDESINPKP